MFIAEVVSRQDLRYCFQMNPIIRICSILINAILNNIAMLPENAKEIDKD